MLLAFNSVQFPDGFDPNSWPSMIPAISLDFVKMSYRSLKMAFIGSVGAGTAFPSHLQASLYIFILISCVAIQHRVIRVTQTARFSVTRAGRIVDARFTNPFGLLSCRFPIINELFQHQSSSSGGSGSGIQWVTTPLHHSGHISKIHPSTGSYSAIS